MELDKQLSKILDTLQDLSINMVEVKLSSKSTENHLKQLNSKVVKNQTAIERNRNNITEISANFANIVERFSDSGIREDKRDLKIEEMILKIEDKVSRLEATRNKQLGAVALSGFVIPILISLAFKFI